MKALVLAAGKGVRLRPLTSNKPKALVELAGKPLLGHVLESLQKAGIEKTVIVVGYLGEKIKERFGASFGSMPLEYVEQKELLGTARAVAVAEAMLCNESFVCTHTDVVVESSIFKELVERFGEKKGSVFVQAVEQKQKFDAVIVGRRVHDPWRFGVLKIAGDKVLGIVEKPVIGEEPSNIINAGIYWLSPKIFEIVKRTKKSERGEFELTDSLLEIAEQGRLGFIEYNGKCFDISTVEDLKEAERLLKENSKGFLP